jgi:hypothetical protein
MHLPPAYPTLAIMLTTPHRTPPLDVQIPGEFTELLRRPDALQYFAMAQVYRRTGGWLSGDDLAMRLRKRSTQPLSLVARWIVARDVVCFRWQSQTWLPSFQFDPKDMSPRREVSGVIEELAGALEDWELALWFCQPNPWLDNAMPVDVIDCDAPAVLNAARVARFIARG